MFWKKKMTSDEYADLLTRVTKLTGDVEGLKLYMEKIDMSVGNLRGLVSRKLGGKRPADEEGDDIAGEIARIKEFFGMSGNQKDYIPDNP